MTSRATPPEKPSAAGRPADAPTPDPLDPPRRRHGWLPSGLLGRVLLVASIPPLAAAILGLPYFLLPLEERAWSPLHEWFKPSGYVGQSAGILAFAMFCFLWLFPMRKRIRFLSSVGKLPNWLDVHIVAGLLIPLVGAIHAAWRFHGVIGLGYFAMLIVSLSGVVGRYLYLRIPRRRDGLEWTREEASAEQRRLVAKLVDRTGIPLNRVVELLHCSRDFQERPGILSTFRRLLRDDWARRRATRQLIAEWKRQLPAGETPDRATLRQLRRAARQEMGLDQQIRVLDATQRLFRLWHVFHLPFAITAFLAVLIHVLVVVAFGATWFL